MRFKAGRRIDPAPGASLAPSQEPSRVRAFLAKPVACGTCAKVRQGALRVLDRVAPRR